MGVTRYVFIGIVLLASTIKGLAQLPMPDLARNFESFQSVLPKAKLHLILNQNKFSVGDTVWFKVYFLKEDLTYIQGNQLINLDLVDSLGESRIHSTFSITQGIGHNQFIIPESVAAGVYFITAYSNWMKNFDAYSIFKQEISIVTNNELVSKRNSKLLMAAEGGHLVRNIANKISICTPQGNSTLILEDVNGNEISKIITSKTGFGSIIFTPEQNKSYSLHSVGESDKISLPIIENDGCTLQLIQTIDSEFMNASIILPPSSLFNKQNLTLIISSAGKINYTASVQVEGSNSVSLKIYKDKLHEGVNHASLLSQTGTVLASRDFYNHSKNQIIASVLSDKMQYQTKEKVRLAISLKNNNNPIAGEFSISVLNSGLFDSEKNNSLSDELNFKSRAIEPFLIDPDDSNWLSDVDDFLILSSESLPWKEILSNEIKKPKFPFSSVIEKTGKAYYSDTGEPLPDLTQIIFYLQKSKFLYQTFALNKGRVSLTLPGIYSNDEFFYLAESKGEEITNFLIKWDSSFFKLPQAPASRVTTIPDRYSSFIDKKRLIDQSFGLYSTSKLITPDNSSNNDNEYANKMKAVDDIINVKDYILFPTMAELVKEVIPSMYHRKTKNKEIVRVKLNDPTIRNNDPLFIIDGIATKNTSFFLSLKPSDLIVIKIIRDSKKLVPLGLLGKNGIVIVQTKNGDAREPLNDSSKLVEGLNKPIDFKEVVHSNNQNLNLPDFRSTIYWNPSIKIDPNGEAIVEFYCSDDIGELSIRIDGLANGGKPFTIQKSIFVSGNSERN